METCDPHCTGDKEWPSSVNPGDRVCCQCPKFSPLLPMLVVDEDTVVDPRDFQVYKRKK